jgi:uncharacterized protein
MATTQLEVLSPDECRALLATQHVGRIGFTIGERPVILPVTYALHDGEVVFRTGAGSKLHASTWRAPVAFQIDGADVHTRSGWSVLVQGMAEAVTHGDELAALQRLPLEPWAPGDKGNYVKVRVEEISGRRLEVSDALAALWWG